MNRNIKFIASIAAIGLTAAAFTGCTRFEEDEFFDESAAVRAVHISNEVQNLLVSAPQGWVIQYHVGYSLVEGFNLFANFNKGGKVTIAGDHRFLRDGNAGKYTESASLYEMLREESIVLSFNTWNDVLTPFVDPVSSKDAPNALNKDGIGMKGDQNLVLKSYNENEIILRGERYGAEIRLVKADRPWREYIADTETMKKNIANSTITSYYLTAGEKDTLYYVGLRAGRFRKSDRVNDPLRIDSIFCCFTPEGFRNEYKDTISGHTFQEFRLAADKSCLESEDRTVRVIPTWDIYMASHNAIWELDASMFSDEQSELYTQLAAEIKKFNTAWSLKSIGFGQSTGGNSINGLVLTCYTNAAKSKTNTLGMTVAQARVAYGLIEFTMGDTPVVDNNMNAAAKKATNLIELTKQFAATLMGRYTVTPNDYFLPTGGTYTPVGEGTAFTLGSNN